MISLEQVSKTYRKSNKKAVDSLSLSIADGEIFGFLGPNGAGKTTTIKLITGILRADEGVVSVDGIDMARKPVEAKRRFGYVSDNPELFARLKAWEYLNFLGDVHGVSTADRQRRVGDLAELFSLSDVLHASLGSYSHGMKQKLVLLGSLIHDPWNWILDEPLVGLDPQSAYNLKELMRQRAAQGKTVFFSTHVMEVAEKLCTRIAIVRQGRVAFHGTLAELKARSAEEKSLEDLFLDLVEDPSTGGQS